MFDLEEERLRRLLGGVLLPAVHGSESGLEPKCSVAASLSAYRGRSEVTGRLSRGRSRICRSVSIFISASAAPAELDRTAGAVHLGGANVTVAQIRGLLRSL